MVYFRKDLFLSTWMPIWHVITLKQRAGAVYTGCFCLKNAHTRRKYCLCLAKVIKLFSQPRISAEDRFVDDNLSESRDGVSERHIWKVFRNILV